MAKKKSKFSRFIKYNKSKIVFFAVVVILFSALVLFAKMMDGRRTATQQYEDSAVRYTDDTVQLETTLVAQPYTLVHKAVDEYLGADASVVAKDVFNKYYKETDRLDVGYPVTLSYDVKSIPSTYRVESAKLILSETDSFTDTLEYDFEAGKTSIDVYHLKTGTTYYYFIKLALNDTDSVGISGTFKTADTPRILSVDGIVNVRDIGGWKTEDGKRVKQGLLYRGSELDGSVEKSYTLTEKGKKTMLDVLKIRSDIDLRPESDNKSGVNALGVERTYHDMQMYGGIFTEKGKAAVKSVFTRLADKENYPAYVHCTYGTDRAGTICYLLEALLGVSADDLMRDYQLSSLKHKSLWALDQMQAFDAQFKKLEGDTMSQKAENYLLSIGITQEQISAIRDIFLS